MKSTILKKKIATKWFKDLRNLICQEFIDLEKKTSKKKLKFHRTKWGKSKIKSEGGGEISILRNGSIFEKVGVNISEVSGRFDKEFKKKIPGTEKSSRFWASGISLVMHMQNPHIPAMHFNTRYIVTAKEWFGGGTLFLFEKVVAKQKKYFHLELKKMCDRHNKNYYKEHKANCDKYFFLPHRNETRGDGGIFYDYLSNNWEKDFLYTKDVGEVFLSITKNIIAKKIYLPFDKKRKAKKID